MELKKGEGGKSVEKVEKFILYLGKKKRHLTLNSFFSHKSRKKNFFPLQSLFSQNEISKSQKKKNFI